MNEDTLGLVDYLAVEFPAGRMTGDGFDLLAQLVQSGTLRVLDLEFVAKAADGSVHKVPLGEVEHGSDIDVTRWQGLSSGLLDRADVEEVGASLEAGSLAGILVYENLWSVALLDAMDRSGARLIGQGRIVPQDLLDQLDSTESS
ncbi:DUF6325 family protein [Streptacidiphilus anmyonensis]|uniref:DUF6325 family protein n=1 Tax=Streptacidiphilus anmyonensis TaxID=405782 RepID=UPI000A9B0CCA|nr:DUF6325 family protein [Streptacidiphilus anmyonensis]